MNFIRTCGWVERELSVVGGKSSWGDNSMEASKSQMTTCVREISITNAELKQQELASGLHRNKDSVNMLSVHVHKYIVKHTIN